MTDRFAPPRSVLLAIGKIVALYAVLGGLWIVFSDSLVNLLVDDPGLLPLINVFKGIAYVAGTSLLLFYLLKRLSLNWRIAGPLSLDDEAPDSPAPPRFRDFYLSMAVIAVGLAGLATITIMTDWRKARATTQSQLQAIANMQVTQLQAWLRERHGDTKLAGASPTLAKALVLWRTAGDRAAQAALVKRLEDFRTFYQYQSALICTGGGELVLEVGDHGHGVSEPLRAAIRRALHTDEVELTDLYHMATPAPAHVHLDFVVPLSAPEAAAIEPMVIVLRTNLDTSLRPLLEDWPLPSASAESVLFGKSNGHVIALHGRAALRGGEPRGNLIESKISMLSTQALAPGYRPGELIHGVDYRGTEVIGIAEPIPGSQWWIVAKKDRAEMLAPFVRESVWTVVASLFTMAAASVLVMLLMQRRELQHVQTQRRDQAEKLQALTLLAAIADNASDAIYAKDRDGRYTFFNRAACGFYGNTEAEVLGHLDRELIGADEAARLRANDLEVMNEDRVGTYDEVLVTPLGERSFMATKGALHDQQGRVIGVYGVSRDVTEDSREAAALRRSNEELQRFNQAMIGREHDMIRLKREINALAKAHGQPEPYDMSMFDSPAGTTGADTETSA